MWSERELHNNHHAGWMKVVVRRRPAAAGPPQRKCSGVENNTRCQGSMLAARLFAPENSKIATRTQVIKLIRLSRHPGAQGQARGSAGQYLIDALRGRIEAGADRRARRHRQAAIGSCRGVRTAEKSAGKKYAPLWRINWKDLTCARHLRTNEGARRCAEVSGTTLGHHSIELFAQRGVV